MIEAMACGTPVIAWRCGAVSERRFTAQGMAARYAQLYRKIASHSPASTRLGLAA